MQDDYDPINGIHGAGGVDIFFHLADLLLVFFLNIWSGNVYGFF